jgi:hypothetical protein
VPTVFKRLQGMPDTGNRVTRRFDHDVQAIGPDE